MSLLKRVTTGKVKRNFLILLYGPEKVGKSTFGSELPDPLFVCGEDGTDQLDVSRIKPKNWLELKEVLRELRDADHDYKTVVLDTIDWLEQLQLRFLMKEHSASNVRAIGGGWGAYKGILKEEWHQFFDLLNQVRKKVNICFLAHSQTKRFSDPLNSCEYDRYELKMEYPEISMVFKEYVDAILFTNFETTVKKDTQTKKVRAYGDNTRILYTEGTHAFDAGNRYGLPVEMNLSAGEMLKFLGQSDEEVCQNLLTEIDLMKKEFKNEDFLKTVSVYVEQSKNDPKKLRGVINKLKIRLSEGEE